MNQTTDEQARSSQNIIACLDAYSWLTTKQLISRMGVPKTISPSITHKLTALYEAGLIERRGNGKYTWKAKSSNSQQQSSGQQSQESIRNFKALEDKVKAALENNQELTKQVLELTEENENAGPREIVIKRVDGSKHKVEGIVHEKFERLLQLAQARQNIFLPGPTGCGKTHICQQIADALDLPFYFISCSAGMSEGVLGGRLLPTGDAGRFEYVISEFVEAYENGGLFLLDEIDAADANVLLVINAALANGKMSVPNRPENPVAERHEDFICIAAANTFGTGSNRLYAGRNTLDAASLSRFQIGTVPTDYDKRVEKAVCPDEELCTLFWKYRENINEYRLERTMSTRFFVDAYKMKTEFNWTRKDIDEAFFSGWSDDEIYKVKSGT